MNDTSVQDSFRAIKVMLALIAGLLLLNSFVALLGVLRMREVANVMNRMMVSTLPERAGKVARQTNVTSGPRLLVELYSDFDCAFCRKSVGPVIAARQTFGDSVEWRYRYRANPARPISLTAALAAICTADSTGPWEFYSHLRPEGTLGESHVREALKAIGRSNQGIQACVQSDSTSMWLWRDMFASSASGKTRTPVVIVDGIEVTGQITEGVLIGLIRDRLRHREQLASGVTARVGGK